jgi:hypothetical protein
MRLALGFCAALGATACADTREGAAPDAGGDGAAQAGTGGVGGSGSNSGVEGTQCDNGIGAGGDGCADSFFGVSGKSFRIEPTPLATGVASDVPVRVVATSYFTIDDSALRALQHTTLLRADSGEPVEAAASWNSSVERTGHEVMLQITPADALTEGWYIVRVEGSLETTHGTPIDIPAVGAERYESLFRVGSAPFVQAVTNCSHTIDVRVSEPVLWQGALPISVRADGNAIDCSDEAEADPPREYIALGCRGLNTSQALEIAFGSGIATEGGEALRNAAGETSFTISMAPLWTGACRTTPEVTEAPAF